jgi:hypothetical protein
VRRGPQPALGVRQLLLQPGHVRLRVRHSLPAPIDGLDRLAGLRRALLPPPAGVGHRRLRLLPRPPVGLLGLLGVGGLLNLVGPGGRDRLYSRLRWRHIGHVEHPEPRGRPEFLRQPALQDLGGGVLVERRRFQGRSHLAGMGRSPAAPLVEQRLGHPGQPGDGLAAGPARGPQVDRRRARERFVLRGAQLLAQPHELLEVAPVLPGQLVDRPGRR